MDAIEIHGVALPADLAGKIARAAEELAREPGKASAREVEFELELDGVPCVALSFLGLAADPRRGEAPATASASMDLRPSCRDPGFLPLSVIARGDDGVGWVGNVVESADAPRPARAGEPLDEPRTRELAAALAKAVEASLAKACVRLRRLPLQRALAERAAIDRAVDGAERGGEPPSRPPASRI